jgi:predicted Zn-dependent protease
MVRARVALNAGRAREAVEWLQPFEGAMAINGPGPVTLLTYGEALLAAGDTPAAIAQFRRLVRHRGLDAQAAEHTLVWVWLARAETRAGNLTAAAEAYETFFKRLPDADADVPLLRAASEELERLRSREGGS